MMHSDGSVYFLGTLHCFVANIGIVSGDYLHPRGGMGRTMQWIASVAAADGHDIFALTPRTAISPLRRIIFVFHVAVRLERWLRARKINGLLLPTGPGGMFLLRRPRESVVVCVACHTFVQQSALVPGQWWKRIFIPLERRTLRMADEIWCFSPEVASVLESSYGIDIARLHLIPHALLRSVQKPDEKDAASCLCIARLDARKGVSTVLRAWPTIVQSCPQATLTIVGRGPNERRIDRFIRKHKASVRRFPYLDDDALQNVLGECGIVLCPSYLEGFGLAALEGMAAGCAVVAADVDGLRSLLEDGKAGVLCSAGKSVEWANAVIGLIRHPEQAQEWGRVAWRSARRFDPPRASAAVAEALCRAMHSR